MDNSINKQHLLHSQLNRISRHLGTFLSLLNHQYLYAHHTSCCCSGLDALLVHDIKAVKKNLDITHLLDDIEGNFKMIIKHDINHLDFWIIPLQVVYMTAL